LSLEAVLERVRPKGAKKVDLGLGEGYEVYVTSDKYNPLVKRREVELTIVHIGQPTPMRWFLRQAIAQLYKADMKNVYVRRLKTEYGLSVTRVEAHIYDDFNRALSFEPAHIICRNITPEELEQEPFKTIYETICLRKK